MVSDIPDHQPTPDTRVGGQLTLVGVPSTEQILKSWSTSLLPGKRGRKVYTSAMMQPTAHRSTGEL